MGMGNFIYVSIIYIKVSARQLTGKVSGMASDSVRG